MQNVFKKSVIRFDIKTKYVNFEFVVAYATVWEVKKVIKNILCAVDQLYCVVWISII